MDHLSRLALEFSRQLMKYTIVTNAKGISLSAESALRQVRFKEKINPNIGKECAMSIRDFCILVMLAIFLLAWSVLFRVGSTIFFSPTMSLEKLHDFGAYILVACLAMAVVLTGVLIIYGTGKKWEQKGP